jgi:hypothetical protein
MTHARPAEEDLSKTGTSKNDAIDEWLSSKEVRARLKLSGCELAHLREEGKLRHRKLGNAYLYHPGDVEALGDKR